MTYSFDKALQECAESVELGEDGRPDRDAMDECMEAKGFTKPEGGPGGGRGPGRPDQE